MKSKRKRKPDQSINDIVPARWREYPDILTDSLWVIDKRDNSGAHSNDYHGNFIPQIPHQVMKRFTRRNDLVVDLFAGLGTTILEARRLGRHSIGIDLNDEVVSRVRSLIDGGADNPHGVAATIIRGDSTDRASTREKLRLAMEPLGRERAQLVIMHPPYLDIIRFSEAAEDLSNSNGIPDFLVKFERSVQLAAEMLDPARYLCLVIGDCYKKQEWIPLGFLAMQAVLNTNLFALKTIIVKNMTGSRGKEKQKNLWRYRSLAHNLFTFSHEYIFLFRRKKSAG